MNKIAKPGGIRPLPYPPALGAGFLRGPLLDQETGVRNLSPASCLDFPTVIWAGGTRQRRIPPQASQNSQEPVSNADAGFVSTLILRVHPNCPGLLGHWIERSLFAATANAGLSRPAGQPATRPSLLHPQLVNISHLPLLLLEVLNAVLYLNQKENKHTKQNKAMVIMVMTSFSNYPPNPPPNQPPHTHTTILQRF